MVKSVLNHCHISAVLVKLNMSFVWGYMRCSYIQQGHGFKGFLTKLKNVSTDHLLCIIKWTQQDPHISRGVCKASWLFEWAFLSMYI